MKYYKLYSNAIIDFYFAGNYVYTMPYAYAKGTISMFAYTNLEPKVLISNLGMMSHDTLVAVIKFYKKASNTGYILMRVDTSKISNTNSWGVFESKYVTESASMVEITEEQAIAEGFTQEFAPVVDYHNNIEDRFYTDKNTYRVQFYHANDTRYLILELGHPYNVTSMFHISLKSNTYNSSIGAMFNADINFYLYNNTIFGREINITNGLNAYVLHKGFFISRNKDNTVVLVFDKDVIQAGRVYISGVCDIESTKIFDVQQYKNIRYVQIADETALNNYLDLTWKFDFNGNNYTYNITSSTLAANGLTPYVYSNVSFRDIVDNLTTQALESFTETYVASLQNMQFLEVANYSGIFMKHNGSNTNWTWIALDAYLRERKIERYYYNASASQKYQITTFIV